MKRNFIFIIALSLWAAAGAAPNNPFFCQIATAAGDTGIENLNIYIDNLTAPNVEAVKAYVFFGKTSDTASILATYASRAPNDSTPTSAITGGTYSHNFTGLTGGTQYHFYVLTSNANKSSLCTAAELRTSRRSFTTKPYPANFLNLSAASSYNTIPLTLGNLTGNLSVPLGSNAYVYINEGSLISDPKCSGCRKETVSLSGAGAGKLYTITNIQPGKNYFVSASFQVNGGVYAPIDTNGANKNGLAVTTLSSIPIPTPVKDSVALSLIDASNLKVDWTKLRNLAGIPGNRFISDAVVLVTDNAYFTGTVTQTEETKQVTTPGAVFLGRAVPLTDNQTVITATGLFSTVKYVTLALKAKDDPAGAAFYSAPVAVGTVQQAAGDPTIEGLEVKQLNDQYVRVKFTPRDPDQAQVSVGATYRVDGLEGANVTKSGIGNIDLSKVGGDAVQVGQPCSAYVDLTLDFIKKINGTPIAAPYFKNSDSTLLTIVIHADDGDVTSGADSEEITLKIDLKPPQPPALSYSVNYNAPQITASVTDNQVGDLQKIFYGATAPTRFAASLDFTPPSGTVNLSSTAIYLAFADSFGNKFYADWSYFVNQSVYLKTGSATTTTQDQGNLKLALVPNTAVDTGGRLNLGRYTLSGTELGVITGQGFDRVKQDGYVLLAQSSGTLNGGRFFDRGFDLYWLCQSTESDLKIYRYIKGTNQVEYLGGRYFYDAGTSTGYLVADALGRDSANLIPYYTPPGSATTADSQIIFLGHDNVEPLIDPNATALNFDGTNMTVHVRATDNTVNLDARVSIFGCEGEPGAPASARGWSRVTFFEQLLHDLDGPSAANTTADADFVHSGLTDVLGQVKTAATLNRGLFAAVTVSDGGAGRRKQFFLSLEQTLPQVSGFFGKTNDWRLVSFPGAPADPGLPLHILDVLKTPFAGKYDRDRVRICRLNPSSGFEEFSTQYQSNGVEKNDNFIFRPNESYMVITRNASDNALAFSGSNVKTPGFKGERGFLIYAATAADNGWRLLSLPFRGAVNVAALDAASVTTHPQAFSSRIYKILGSGAFPWVAMNPAALLPDLKKLGSAADYNDCFLAYLFPGDSLFAPLTDDTAFFKGAARRAVTEPRWTLELTLKTARGELLDAANRLGVAPLAQSLPDLPTMGPAVLSLMDNDGNPLTQNLLGEKSEARWGFSVINRADSALSLKLEFSAPPPAAGTLYLLDRKAGLFVDVASLNGGYPLSLAPRARTEFEIVAGASAPAAARLLPAPAEFNLSKNTPNPFNPATLLRYQVPLSRAGSYLALDIYDAAGRRVASLARGAAMPGYYSALFDGRDARGNPLASGFYFARLSAADGRGRPLFSQFRRMILLR